MSAPFRSTAARLDAEPAPPSGSSRPLPEDVANGAVVRALLRRAQQARRDPTSFFSFVMKEEHGARSRLVAAAHQRVIFEFVMAHPRCVLRIPSGFSKTYCMASLTLWLLGNDPTARGVVVSATREGAAKPVAMVRDYIENRDNAFPELRLVFPELRPSDDPSDPWTQNKLTVKRPPGIRDPSLVAVGEDGQISGSRLSWFLIDDLLSELNTVTKESCLKTRRWFASTVLSRKDVKGARIVVCNTPWHPEDLTFALEKTGWPTLSMDCYGNITIANADAWDSDELRASVEGESLGYHRLAAHDRTTYGAPLCQPDVVGEWMRANAEARNDNAAPFDLDDEVPLWPEKFDREAIDGPDGLRELFKLEPGKFAQLYLCRVRADEDAAVKVEQIEACKALGRELGHYNFVASYDGPNLTVLGVDLAISKGKHSANTSFFVYELLPDGKRKILYIDVGKYSGREIVEKIKGICAAYGCLARVETNAAQDFIRQWVLDEDGGLPLMAHHTGKGNKRHPAYGVQSVFIALQNGAWVIPCDPTGTVPKAVELWLEDCLFYKPPPAHTGDVLMSCWLATEQERHVHGKLGSAGRRRANMAEVGAALLAR